MKMDLDLLKYLKKMSKISSKDDAADSESISDCFSEHKHPGSQSKNLLHDTAEPPSTKNKR